ncbi:MAG: AraC family transcriptional regulator [Rhodospirillum sp.]|nr:AraC family transcriptional regulator [Rhodospirillum sp.]MCF8489971.1 AraC family transcriptional regulator [Rhodospirillum sp.]MCF8501024.1 AraC family transcriptional regulator [Rhodospirillum sp.]
MDGPPGEDAFPPSLTIRQTRLARFHRLISPIPAVVVVRSGVKGVATARGTFDVPEGFAVLIPGHTPLSIENRPKAEGLYRAESLPLSWAVLDQVYGRGGIERSGPERLGPVPLSSGMEEAFLAAARIQAEPEGYPDRVRSHRLGEILLWLAEEGAVFGPPPHREPSHRVREVVSEDLARPWKAGEVAARLAMSEPTLRRHLATEGETFTDLLADARMTQALALLQASNWTVEAVAAAVGYASPSRFAVRFRVRFGLAPSEIRGASART